MEVANLDEYKRATAPALLTDPTARYVCWGHVVLHVLRDYSAPDAFGAVRQNLVLLLRFKRMAETMNGYLGKFDLLRSNEGACMRPGGASPEAFVTVLCIQDASFPRPDKSPCRLARTEAGGKEKWPRRCAVNVEPWATVDGRIFCWRGTQEGK